MPIMHLPVVLIFPIVVWALWVRSIKTVYSGPASVMGSSLFVFPQRGQSRPGGFLSVNVPEHGWLTACVEGQRAERIDRSAMIPVDVVVCRAFACKPYIKSIKWPSEEPEPVDGTTKGAAVLAALYYFLAGLAFFAGASFLGSELALICSGFVCGWALSSGPHQELRAPVSMWIMLVSSGVCSVALFAQPSALTFFPGIVIAFSFGQVGGMLSGFCKK